MKNKRREKGKQREEVNVTTNERRVERERGRMMDGPREGKEIEEMKTD